MKFNKLLALVGACATFGLVACGDDSSSGAANGSKTYEMSIVNFDEANRSITYYMENKNEYCVLDEAKKSASWQTIDEGNDTVSMKYDFVTLPAEVVSFIKDSLNISVSGNTAMNLKVKNDYGYEYSMGLYVGGDASSAKGTWVSVPCSEDVEVYCLIREKWDKVTLKISSSTITADIERVNLDFDNDYDYDYDDDYYTDDISKSGLISSLYESLTGDYIYVSTGYSALENSERRIADQIQELGIEVKSSSKTSQKFVINNKTYDLNAKTFEMDEYENVKIDLTLASDGNTCALSVENGNLEGDFYDKNACRDDLYEYYRTESEHDYMGNKFTYAYEYKKNNGDEFESCIGQMASASRVYDVYYKMANPRKSDAEFWDEYEHKIHKLLKLFK